MRSEPASLPWSARRRLRRWRQRCVSSGTGTSRYRPFPKGAGLPWASFLSSVAPGFRGSRIVLTRFCFEALRWRGYPVPSFDYPAPNSMYSPKPIYIEALEQPQMVDCVMVLYLNHRRLAARDASTANRYCPSWALNPPALEVAT
jgi:hypothetical protein